MSERCSWCGEPVEAEDGYRAAEPAGERRAAFCRLEHVVPWAIQGPHWEPGELAAPVAEQHHPDLDRCAYCGEAVGELRIVLVRHRGEHRIPDVFCDVDHLRRWAAKGGRWG